MASTGKPRVALWAPLVGLTCAFGGLAGLVLLDQPREPISPTTTAAGPGATPDRDEVPPTAELGQPVEGGPAWGSSAEPPLPSAPTSSPVREPGPAREPVPARAPAPAGLGPGYDPAVADEVRERGQALRRLLQVGSEEQRLLDRALVLVEGRRSALPPAPEDRELAADAGAEALAPVDGRDLRARIRALEGRHPDPEARRELELLLHHPSATARCLAARGLSRWHDFAAPLQARMGVEGEASVQRVILNCFAERGLAEHVHLMAEWAASPQLTASLQGAAVRSAARIAARTGVPLPAGLPETRRGRTVAQAARVASAPAPRSAGRRRHR